MRTRIQTMIRGVLAAPADALYRMLDERIDDGPALVGPDDHQGGRPAASARFTGLAA